MRIRARCSHSADKRQSTPMPTALRLVFAVLVALLVANGALPAHSQTLKVLYRFTGGQDGNNPLGLTFDASGNLYGTTSIGGYTGGACNPVGYPGCGTIFKLSPQGDSWTFSSLYSFQGYPNDGGNPTGPPVISNGVVYGATLYGASCQYCGTIFRYGPSPIPSGWTERIQHQFQGPPDGQLPSGGHLVSDRNGNLFGMTQAGGGGSGTVYELTRSGVTWSESVIYNFLGGSDGWGPVGGLTIDDAGNLYGMTEHGGSTHWPGFGTVFMLTHSQSGWTKTTLYRFQGRMDGEYPMGTLTIDSAGNLYGASSFAYSGLAMAEAVFMLTPNGGNWSFKVLHNFLHRENPGNNMVLDANGNLYGLTQFGGCCSLGTIFKLTPQGDGTWRFTTFLDFHDYDVGWQPSNIILGSDGNLYGTNWYSFGGGTVWEVTP